MSNEEYLTIPDFLRRPDCVAAERRESASGSNDLLCDAFDMEEITYKSGQECSMGCGHHVTHRCEKCGRYAAQGEVTLLEPKQVT